MLQSGLTLWFIRVCLTVCHTVMKVEMLLIEHPHMNSLTSVLTFSPGLVVLNYPAHCCSVWWESSKGVVTSCSDFWHCYVLLLSSWLLCVYLLSELLWIVCFFLNLWNRLNSEVSCGKWLCLERWQKVTTFIEIVLQLEDKAGDTLHLIYCQQLRPEPMTFWWCQGFSDFPTSSIALSCKPIHFNWKCTS